MARHKQTTTDNDGGLFGDMLQEDTDAMQSGPVTVLGLTFADDEERRAYFRTELRAQLPELRKIEGFPIGSDDDIINLSDPPYYTACPNPWLNDFIAQWEQEKKQLEADGKRKVDFDITEPYAADVSEGKSNPIYLAHSYHTKVPHPAIMRYILHYTQPGDIIFDGFCGTGMTGVASNMCAIPSYVRDLGVTDSGIRHSILSDLSPIASLISASYNTDFSPSLFENKALSILSQVENELGYLFELNLEKFGKSEVSATVWSDVYKCPNCDKTIILWNQSVDTKNSSIKDSFDCPNCGLLCDKKSLTQVFTTSYDSILGDTIHSALKVPVRTNVSTSKGRHTIDGPIQTSLVEKIQELDIPGHKTYRMPEGDEARRNDKFGIKYTHQFYTKRTYLVLSRIYDLVKHDTVLLAWFTSALISTTMMNRFRFSGTGVNSGTLYIPSLNWEFSPFQTLRRKVQTFVSAYYQGRGGSVVGINSATSVPNLPSESVDYIFTDPPFGANFSYSDLNAIWESWLNVFTDNSKEAIVSRTQKKNVFDYQNLMYGAFNEYYRVLKPGKWMTVEFSNTSASVWNSIQTALQNVGFIVANVSALDKKQGSFKAVTTTTAVKQDLIISCFKPSEKMLELFKESTDTAQNVWDFIDELLSHLPVHLEKEQKTTAVVERSPKILYDRLISYYVQRGFLVPLGAKEFQDGLRERFFERDGMFFTADQAFEYESKKKATIGFEAAQTLFVSSEAEGIEWLKRELQEPKTYAQLTNPWNTAQISPKKGDKIPELKTILEENFIQDKDERWHTPDPEKEADLEKIRNRRLAYEFKLIAEEVQKPKSRIKDARLEALRYGFTEAYRAKDFETIVKVAHKLPEALVMEDEVLLRYYDIAINHV